MKILIKNFGPIKEYEYDLAKDFHLLVGENNVGKSYAITVVYLSIKTLIESRQKSAMLTSGYFNIDFFGTERSENVRVDINNINHSVSKALTDRINRIFIEDFQNSLGGTFESIGLLKNQFSNNTPSITFSTKNYSLQLDIVEKNIQVSNFIITKEIEMRGIKTNRKNLVSKEKITAYYITNEEESLNRSFEKLVSTLQEEFFDQVVTNIDSIHYLPASRSGLYQALGAFGQIVAELSKSRAFVSKKIELPGIAEPVSDYFIKLTEISVKKRQFENKAINKIAEKIENEIIHGKVEFDSNSKRLMYKPTGTSLNLDLSTTSSMVSELSPIVSYIRYILTKPASSPWVSKKRKQGKTLILIEEPEAHLHPEIQIKMSGIFADLVKEGVKVTLTSHSNYIFNKINNLILEKRFDDKKVQAAVFKMTQEGSIGKLLEVDELGIDDENFLDAAELLFSEKINLLEKLNNDK